jgi:DNA-binding transcriptional MerR regulator
VKGVDAGWSLEEFAERVAQALAADGVRAPNGRVRDVPDARAIRWYATIGLVDRPHVGPRRASRYSARHLLQVVAVKRRQAEGRSLAEIQAELTGAPEHALRAAARIPDELLATAPPDPPARARSRFWATAPAPATPAAPVPVENAPAPAVPSVSYLIPLSGGATLSLPTAPTAADLAEIRSAAAPLLDLLADRGLLKGEHDHDRPAH